MDVLDVREVFVQKLNDRDFVTDKTGVRTIEIVGASFKATEPLIFGEVNEDYVSREIAWYESKSLNVNDIAPPVPEIWKRCADSDGFINSNYGWMIYSVENHNQYECARRELSANPDSRRAVMIYQRPTMWSDYKKNGRSDFCCTNAHQYMIRDGELQVVVQMRSNDVVFGYRNDFAWAKHVQKKLLTDLRETCPTLREGPVFWQVGSLHVYERHFFLVDWYGLHKDPFPHVLKKDYREKFPDREWSA